MSRAARHVVLLGGLATLAVTLVVGLRGLPDFGHFGGRYSQIVAYSAVPERHAPNTVIDTAFDYRAVDTLGEEMILFSAAVGVALLLRSRRTDEEDEAGDRVAEAEEHETSMATRRLGTALVGPVAVLGIYIVTHGHLSPGGGFQGGVIVMAAVLLPLLAGRYVVAVRLRGHTAVELAEAAGAAGFALIGLGGLIASGAFLQNFLGKGPPGLLNSGGTILPSNVAVGLEVAGALLVVVAELEDPRFLVRGGRQ
jgi:multicomponent Na+:H+ antiporter subunit B